MYVRRRMSGSKYTFVLSGLVKRFTHIHMHHKRTNTQTFSSQPHLQANGWDELPAGSCVIAINTYTHIFNECAVTF